jgi:hydroxyacylglutathione hydrolase
MEIKQFRYGVDNLAYVIHEGTVALTVDPGAVEEILSFVTSAGLQLQAVVNTHTHPDHMIGNEAIVAATGADYIAPAELIRRGYLELEQKRLDIHHTPGHTEDSLVLYFDGVLVTGDTLFTGKAGRCFTGDLEKFLASIQWIMALPENTVIYGGHDYVLEYLETARQVEPENAAIEAFAARYDPAPACSTLADEYQINPTLRFNTPELIAVLEARGLPVGTEYERWQSVMSIV